MAQRRSVRVLSVLRRLRLRARVLKWEAYALFLAVSDPRTPWYARVVAAAVVGYTLSPLDLIPDFIPVVGYLDDLIVVPLGVALALKLVPKPVMAECRQRAQAASTRPVSRIGAAFIIAVWLVCGAWVVLFLFNLAAG
jgi:uncharacterized membrane protein YkvA (DUF1232 family)